MSKEIVEWLERLLPQNRDVAGRACLLVLRLLVERQVLLGPAALSDQAAIKAHERRVMAEALDRLEELSAFVTARAQERPPAESVRTSPAQLPAAVAAVAGTAASLAAPRLTPLDQIAAIMCDSYAEARDDAVLADDEALELIRDLLFEADPEIIERNRGRSYAGRERYWGRWLAGQ